MKDLLIELSPELTLHGVSASVLWHDEISGFLASHIVAGIMEDALGVQNREMLHICLSPVGESQRGGRNDHTQQGDAQQGADDGLRFAEHVQHGQQETSASQADANCKDRDKQIRVDTLTEATEHGYKDHQGAVEEVCEEEIRCHSANNHRNHPSDICRRTKC